MEVGWIMDRKALKWMTRCTLGDIKGTHSVNFEKGQNDIRVTKKSYSKKGHTLNIGNEGTLEMK